MRLAASNIAWPSGRDEDAAAVLREHGAEGVELAPTKVWERPLEASDAEVAACRSWWERRGLRVVALQALLFGQPELTLFDGPGPRRRAVAYLKGMIDLAGRLGAGALVFGSPKNRRVGDRPRDEADATATPVFAELGDFAAERGTWFCIEPNPPEYGCDFATTTDEAAALVRRVGRPGFGLHLDSGGMALAGEPAGPTLARHRGLWRHVHVSEPYLVPIGHGTVAHPAFAAALRQSGYQGWVSIEMKEPDAGRPWAEILGASLALVQASYAGPPPSRRPPADPR